MLSRATFMAPTALLRCDIFCNVIDNFGDMGVCWRLARQLVGEYGLYVRLWVDDLAAFSRICPGLNPLLRAQVCLGVDIRLWQSDFPAVGVMPGEIVIEAFACHLPEAFVEAMAERRPKPVWINLDYLSAESWVSGCHALPSPHPQRPITKHFFFPGFDETTGGLLRECGLIEQRDRFLASPEEQTAFWQRIGTTCPGGGVFKVSLFAYENPGVVPLLSALANTDMPAVCLAPMTRTQRDIEDFLGEPVQTGDVIQRGRLEIRVLPFMAQEDYDRLLWASDLNFVRGEDSFVRAQWAARPMIWHIYPQSDDAHRVKLDADLAAAMMGINAVTGVEIGDGFDAARLTGEQNADRIKLPRIVKTFGKFAAENSTHQTTFVKQLLEMFVCEFASLCSFPHFDDAEQNHEIQNTYEVKEEC